MAFQYNFYGPLEIDKDGLERMAKVLFNSYEPAYCTTPFEDNKEPWIQDAIKLIKAYHGIPQ
jgi:hypothetical protein